MRHSPVDRFFWEFLMHLTRTTSLHWERQRQCGVIEKLEVRWDADVTAANDLTIAHIQALDTLKRFEGCFVELRHLNVENVLVFEGLANKMAIAYRRVELNNAELDKRLGDRWFSYRCELNNCQIHITNKDYLPVLTVSSLGGKKDRLT
jgi:hypothetical protein